ncbi:MAG: transposase [Patescibacteria group bacterium]
MYKTKKQLQEQQTLMTRSCVISLKFITEKKRNKLKALLSRYRSAVNFYINLVWNNRDLIDVGLKKQTYGKCQIQHLSARFKNAALKQAIEIITSTIASAEALGAKPTCPKFTGMCEFDAKVLNVLDNTTSNLFDLIVELSTLDRGNKIALPTKSTERLNYWLEKPGAKLIPGGKINEDVLIVRVSLPIPEYRQEGRVVGCDIGINKLIVTTDGIEAQLHGTEMKAMMASINRKKPGSKGRKRAQRRRDNFVSTVVRNAFDWKTIKTIGVEDLRGLKQGKRKNQSRAFRRTRASWTYRQVVGRLEQISQENGIFLVKINPAYSSQTCPKCNAVHRDNRKGENFLCTSCGYSNDSDVVGAENILERTLRLLRSWSP